MMTEDEDQEIVAALAKLAGQDASAADDARAALEWIAGEQDLAFITQARIQNDVKILSEMAAGTFNMLGVKNIEAAA